MGNWGIRFCGVAQNPVELAAAKPFQIQRDEQKAKGLKRGY
jgi:hypothetical protein